MSSTSFIRRLSTTFNKLKLHPSITTALHESSFTTPTNIQTLAAPEILSGKHTLIAAETGAGKTLAYLAPLLSVLKSNEKSAHTQLHRPTAIVLAPTRELTNQLLTVTKQLSHHAKFRARSVTGGPSSKSSLRSLKQSPIDVLLATPGTLQRLRNNNLLYLSRVTTLVLDEADVLLSERTGFAEQVLPVIDALIHKSDVQFIYTLATLPKRLHNELCSKHPNLSLVRTKQLHCAMATEKLHTTFIRVSGSYEAKVLKAIEIVTTALARYERVLLFCNHSDRREALVERLRVMGIAAVHLAGGGDTNDAEQRIDAWEAFVKGEALVAICSQSFERGIDVPDVRNVVLLDVPFTGGEYLHRVGRIRDHGRAYVLVGHKEMAVAEALFLAHVRGENLNAVDAKKAWRDYTGAGRDRITTDRQVRVARKSSRARWVDERDCAVHSFRGRQLKRRSGRDMRRLRHAP